MLACSSTWLERTGVEVAWDWRSLTSFGDEPLETLAPAYDLLVIDHPFCGTAAATACLVPLDDLLPAVQLDEHAADSMGASHVSYTFAGRQWALAVDAACQVTAVRDDVLRSAPIATWEDVLALARSRPGSVALPLSPAHSISSWLTLIANAGHPAAQGASVTAADTGTRALELLGELCALGPAEAVEWEPPDALGRLTDATDGLACVPLTYGYVTYSTAGAVEHPCRFADIPSGGSGPVGSVLGGAGLAVSFACRHPQQAADFAAWACGREAQVDVVARSGGQPASAAAWHSSALDAAAGGFYSGTRRTIASAWVRPREAWWPAFQLEGGRLLTVALASGTPAAATFSDLDALYRDCRRRRQ
jgi:multiple sugar transport system substrate-binding protein